jgi:hypothetical protein
MYVCRAMLLILPAGRPTETRHLRVGYVKPLEKTAKDLQNTFDLLQIFPFRYLIFSLLTELCTIMGIWTLG